MKPNRNTLFTALAFGVLMTNSCKKNSDDAPASGTTGPAAVTDKIKDSVLLYTKDIYLWYNQIPTSFSAQTYADPDKIMTGIRQYSTETGFAAPVDRWSFAVKQAEWDNLSSGISGDFGLSVFFLAEGDLRVKLVERDSPAGKAGIRRGWRIIKINGNSTITTSNSDFIVQNIFNNTSSSFTFQKPDNSTVDLTLAGATYQEHPVVLDSVYNRASGNVGYFVFNSFLGDTTEIYNEFNRVVNRFAAASVSDVVVDLRYNGGGYVNVQEKLADYLAPVAANGNVMMSQQYNNKYTQYNSTTVFRKLGLLNLNRIFFIVSSSTASASELLINNLKPYMQTILVGPGKTYGKPVGFFPIPVSDWYIFPVSFRTTNKAGEGAYFDGLPLNKQVSDGLNKDWGDVTESAFASTLNYIATGTFRTAAGSEDFTESAGVKKGNTVLDVPAFKGTIGMPQLK